MSATLNSAAAFVGVREQVPDLCDIPLGPQQACEQVAQVAEDAASSVLDDLVDILIDGYARLIRIAMAWWTDFPSPELAGASGEPGSALSAVREFSSGLQVLFLIAGIMFAAARLALAKRGGVAGEAQESFMMLARASFMSMAFAVLVTTGTRAGDNFANWVIFSATGGDWVGAVDRLTTFDQKTAGQASLGTGVLLIIGLLGLIGTLIQLVMLVMRQALLILAVAVLPLAAAASGTGPGSQSYKKLLSWSLAFVLFKPAGALVYAIAFTVIGDEEQTDPQQIMLGLILLLMSVVVLPALVRMIAPAVSTLGGGGGASSVLAGGAAGVAMGSAGDRGSARTVSEGEDAADGSGPSGGSSQGGGGTGGGGGGGSGGGGRPLGGGDDGSAPGSASSAGGGATGGSTSSGGSGGARPAAPAGKSAGSASQGASASGAGGAGAAGGSAGAIVMAAQEIKSAGDQAVSAIESQTRDAADGGWNPDSLSPGEVRR